MAPVLSVPSGAFQTILIIDLGSQYTQLIARRVRELNVYSEIVDNKFTAKDLKKRPEIVGLILSGGPNSAPKFGSPKIDPELLDGRIPVLGICYGLQLIGTMLGCKVETARFQEFGRTELWVDNQEDSLLFRGLNPFLVGWMSHADCVAASPALPRGARVTAHTDATPVAAFEWPARKLYAVQFHPEVTHTPWGIELLRNWAYGACNVRGDWTMGNFVEMATEQIRVTVDNTPPGGLLVATAQGIRGADGSSASAGQRPASQPQSEVICAVSGGVDSLCTAALVDRAIGERLHPIFVDHGFLRAEEGNKVVQAWRGHFKSQLIRVNAGPRFLAQLKGVSDPERKRKIIGREFIDVFDEHARSFKKVKFLAQGTLYPDVIEARAWARTGR